MQSRELHASQYRGPVDSLGYFHNWDFALKAKKCYLMYLQALFRTRMAQDLGFIWEGNDIAVRYENQAKNKDGYTRIQIMDSSGMNETDMFMDNIIRVVVSRSPISFGNIGLNNDNVGERFFREDQHYMPSTNGVTKTNLLQFNISITVVAKNGITAEALACFIAAVSWAVKVPVLNSYGVHSVDNISIGPEQTVYRETDAGETRQAVQVDFSTSMQISLTVNTTGFLVQELEIQRKVLDVASNIKIEDSDVIVANPRTDPPAPPVVDNAKFVEQFRVPTPPV
jgi:hypothetical protein